MFFFSGMRDLTLWLLLKCIQEKLEQTRDDSEALLKSRAAEHETAQMNLIQEHLKSVEVLTTSLLLCK